MSQINFAECLYFSSARLNRMIAKISDDTFKKMGLSSTAAFILMGLEDGDVLYPSQLATELSLDRSTITRFLDKLQRDGLIERTMVGRSVEVRLSPAGRQLQPELMQTWSDLNKHYQDLFGVEEEATLRGHLNEQFEAHHESI